MTTDVVDARSSITRISPTKSVYYTVVSSLNQHVGPTALKHVFNDAAVSAVTAIPRIEGPDICWYIFNGFDPRRAL